MRVAWELGRLPDLRASLDTWKPQNAEQRKALAAFEMILAIAELDFEAALTAIDRLIEVIAENPIVAAERGPEAVAMWIGKQHAQTLEAARDLAFQVYEDARNHNGPDSDRWQRQVFSLKQWLQAAADSATTGRGRDTI